MKETWSKARVKGRVEGRVPPPAPVTRQGDARPSPKRTPSTARACKSHVHGSGRRGGSVLSADPRGVRAQSRKPGLTKPNTCPRRRLAGAHVARVSGKAGRGQRTSPRDMTGNRRHPSADLALNERMQAREGHAPPGSERPGGLGRAGYTRANPKLYLHPDILSHIIYLPRGHRALADPEGGNDHGRQAHGTGRGRDGREEG